MSQTFGTTPMAVALIAVGYAMASNSISDWERFVNSIFIPLYQCVVGGYLILRVYHVAIEPRLKAQSTSTATKQLKFEPTTSEFKPDKPVNLTGLYKLVENQNFEGLLEAQGVPWALRRAANMARPTHGITHKGETLTIKIEGIIESQTTYTIGGPPVRGLVRERVFEDQVTYLEDNTGVQTRKRAVDDGYTVKVRRHLGADRATISMLSTVEFDDKSKPAVECKQLFKRVQS